MYETSGEGGAAVEPAVAPGLALAQVREWRALLAAAALQPVGTCGGPEADRAVDLMAELEGASSAIAAAQARLAVVVDRGRRAQEAASGVPARRRGAGVTAEIGLARRVSVHRAGTLLGTATAVTVEMPRTFAALAAGHLNEWRTVLLVRETACLPVEDREHVDDELCRRAGAGVLAGCGDRELVHRARQATYRLDPASVTRRAARAEADRRVTLRPAPDTMTYLSALLPVTQGVAAYAALTRAAASARAGGDARGRGQVMADTLVEHVTGQGRAEDVPVCVNLVMTDAVLFAAAEDPARVPGYGTVPAAWARDVVAGSSTAAGRSRSVTVTAAAAATTATTTGRAPDVRCTGAPEPTARRQGRARRWVRRLYRQPVTGELVAMESRSRVAPPGLAELIEIRDAGACRVPWCDAPGRHVDHVQPHREGGATTAANLQLLCEAHNYAKESPGWSMRPLTPDRSGAPRSTGPPVAVRTPSGRKHSSRPPPLPGSPVVAPTDDPGTTVGSEQRALDGVGDGGVGVGVDADVGVGVGVDVGVDVGSDTAA